MCAHQEYTLLIVGGCERKRGRGRKKKEGEKGRGNDGKGRERDDERAPKKYKKPDRARNFSPSHIFHVKNCAISLIKFGCASYLSQIEQIIKNCFLMT